MSRSSLLLVVLVALLSLSLASGQSCSGAGYDLSSLAGQIYNYSTPVVGGQNNYTYIVSPCGSIPLCGNSSFCQYVDYAAYYPLQVFNSSVSVEWLAVSGGVSQIVQDGSFCGAINAYRATTIFFQCNASATTAVLTGVQETETCHYSATLQTAAACQATSTTGANGVGSSFESSICGGGLYDLSSLEVDLYLDSNVSSSTYGFKYWLRLCGAVTNSSCSSFPSAMACQTDKDSPPDVYELAYLNASIPGVYTINSYGLTMQLQDGTSCGADGPRALTVNLVCSPSATTPALTAFAEFEVCHYQADVTTSAVCGAATAGSSSGTAAVVSAGSSSSSPAATVVPGNSSTGNDAPSNPSNSAAFATASSSLFVLLIAALVAVASLTL